MRQFRSRRRSRVGLPFWLLLLAAAAAFVWWDNTSLQTTHTDITLPDLPAGFEGYRIAVLSDLQAATFGDGNQPIIDAVAAAKPELILFPGDLADRKRALNWDAVNRLLRGLCAIAPTYYVTGNHEWATGEAPTLKAAFAQCGVTVLDNRYVTLERNGDTLVLAGVDDPNGYADQETPEELSAEIRADAGDSFWMLLAHRNDRFEGQYSHLGADLVISGHGHGGIIRLPGTDGLVGTQRNLFPSYTAGVYEANGSTLFVTRGLANSFPAVRLFNRPEIAVLTLYKGSNA